MFKWFVTALSVLMFAGFTMAIAIHEWWDAFCFLSWGVGAIVSSFQEWTTHD